MLALFRAIAGLRSEHGFTLIETLVAMVTGLIISLAAFTLLQVATDASSRASDFVQASQLGRTAMSHIVDELNSACVAEKATPILEKSGPYEVYFITGFSEKTEIQPSEIQRHEVYWKASAANPEIGSLYDAKAVGIRETSKDAWEFGALSSPGVLLDADIEKPRPAGKPSPIFKYYEFGKETTESATSGLSAVKEITYSGALGKVEAEKVASMTIDFRSLPTDNSEKPGRDLELNDEVTFAFSAGFTEPTITSSGACQ